MLIQILKGVQPNCLYLLIRPASLFSMLMMNILDRLAQYDTMIRSEEQQMLTGEKIASGKLPFDHGDIDAVRCFSVPLIVWLFRLMIGLTPAFCATCRGSG